MALISRAPPRAWGSQERSAQKTFEDILLALPFIECRELDPPAGIAAITATTGRCVARMVFCFLFEVSRKSTI